MKKSLIEVKPDNESGQIGFHIPVESQEFAKILSDLLKSPRRISFLAPRNFEINKDGISHISNLLAQRIHEQHTSTLLSCQIDIYYQNGRSQRCVSLEDFLSYSELDKSRALMLEAAWIFLVDLPGSTAPQKQTVRVLFAVEKPQHSFLSEGMKFAFDRSIFLRTRAYVSFEIEHTHITLGNDIANLLMNELHREPERKLASRIANNHLFHVLLVTMFAGLVTGMFAALSVSVFKFLFEDRDVGEIVQSGDLTMSIFFAVAVAGTSLFLGFAVGRLVIYEITRSAPSWIILSAHASIAAKKAREEYRRRFIRRVYGTFGTLTLGVAASLFVWLLTGSEIR